jgi:hypothetical protein
MILYGALHLRTTADKPRPPPHFSLSYSQHDKQGILVMKISKKSFFLILCSLIFVLVSYYLSCEKDFSGIKIITPPDTTSHNFTWTIDTFGVISSYLLDVAIINENDIWAVGAIQPDPTGVNDIYNAIHWNGQQWQLKRIPYIYNGQPFYHPINFSFSFENGEVWFGGNGIVRWNGINFSNVEIDQNAWGPVAINKMWGSTTDDVLIVGDEGSIAHYDGSSWQKLESGTTVDLLDVWGSPDGSVVWACGYTDFVGTILLKITGTTVEIVYEDIDNWFNVRPDSISGVLTSLWTNDPSKLYIITPAGMYVASANTHGEAHRLWTENNFLPGFPRALRGRTGNDLFTAGDFSFMAHYNGASWHIYNRFAGRIRSRGIAITKNLLVLAGLDIQSNRATIIRGER